MLLFHSDKSMNCAYYVEAWICFISILLELVTWLRSDLSPDWKKHVARKTTLEVRTLFRLVSDGIYDVYVTRMD